MFTAWIKLSSNEAKVANRTASDLNDTTSQRHRGNAASCLSPVPSVTHGPGGETPNPRPEAFSASRFDLELRAKMWLSYVGDCRWTTSLGTGRRSIHRPKRHQRRYFPAGARSHQYE